MKLRRTAFAFRKLIPDCLVVHFSPKFSLNGPVVPRRFSRYLAMASLAAAMGAPLHAGAEREVFKDHGVIAPVAEDRILIATEGKDGEPLIVSIIQDSFPRNTGSDSGHSSLLIHNAKTGKTQQYWPARHGKQPEDVFSALVSSGKKLYYCRENTFSEFDLSSREYSANVDVGGCAMSVGEAADGTIYFATYPRSELFAFDPATKQVRKLARLDAREQYPINLGIDSAGWVYVGIGTAQSNIVGYYPPTGEVRSLLKDEERMTNDEGLVVVDESGKVFGRPNKNSEWMLLEGGKMHPAPGFVRTEIKRPRSSVYFMSSVVDFPDGGRIENYSLENRSFDYISADGTTVRQTFSYETEGASIGSMVVAGNGKLYGSTHHPMVFWEYDFATGKSHCYGPLFRNGSVRDVACLTKFALWKNDLVSNSYARGDLYVFDPSEPFNNSEGPEGNPLFLMRTEPIISRPHTMITYPESPYVLSAGWPGYGLVGGGLLIYNMEQRQPEQLIPAEELLPKHTLTSMVVDGDGNIPFGTSAAVLSGGHSDEKDARVGVFDWKKRQVTWSMVPVPGADLIVSICLGPDHTIFGVTRNSSDNASVFFAVDLKTQKVVKSQVLEEQFLCPAAGRGDNAFVSGPDGRIFLVMTKAILEVMPETQRLKVLAKTPVSAFEGGPVVDGRLYFSSAGRLWSYLLPSP